MKKTCYLRFLETVFLLYFLSYYLDIFSIYNFIHFLLLYFKVRCLPRYLLEPALLSFEMIQPEGLVYFYNFNCSLYFTNFLPTYFQEWFLFDATYTSKFEI